MVTFIRLFTYTKYKWATLLTGTLLTIMAAGLAIYAPSIGSRIIDRVTADFQAHRPFDVTAIIESLIFYTIVVNTGVLMAYEGNVLLSRAANGITKVLRDQAHFHMQQLPVSYFDNKPAGKISARIVNDIETLRTNYYLNFLNQMLLNVITVIGVYIALFLVAPQVSLALLLLLPIFGLWQVAYVKLVQPLNFRWREIISDLNSQTAELIQGIAIVQIFKREATMKQAFDKINDDWTATRSGIIDIDATLTWNMANLLRNMAIFAVLVFVGTRFTEGILGLSIGTLYLVIEYISRLFDPISMIVRLVSFLQQALAAGTRVFELLDSPVEEDSDLLLKVPEGVVEFRDVTFAYKEGHPVLHHLSFKAEKGQTIALVGHTGSGKSSIINLLFRFYDPQEGVILIDGQNIRHCQRESIRDTMGIVLQDPYLFSGTIGTNVSMHDDTITDDQVLEALDKVGAQDMLSKLAKGIHEPVQEKGQSLSSGERQLISFARALAINPKILILDEATSHIDTETEFMIQNAMNVVKEGRTTFIVAHRLSTIQNADKILVLDQGRIIEEGNHQSLMALDGYYAEMYRLQARLTL